MKYGSIYLVLLVLVTGCGPSEESTTNDQATGQQENKQAAARATEFGNELNQLKTTAHQHEKNLEFSEAATIWAKLYQRIASQFGEKSWQAKNAEVAYASAVRNSRMIPVHTEQLKEAADISSQIKLAYEGSQIERALELSQRLKKNQVSLFGANSVDAARQLIQIASLESKLGLVARAVSNYHAGIETLRKNEFADHPELEIAHAGLASLYARQKKYSPAVANQKAATQIAGRIWGISSLQYATQANQLGVIFHRAGNLNVAEEILNTAMQIRRKELGATSTAFAHSSLNLGVVMLDKQQLAEAYELLSRALPVFQTELGESDSLTLRCKSQIATILMLQKQPQLAERFLADVVETMIQKKEAEPDDLLNHQYKLAVALAKQGKYDRAQPLIEHVVNSQQSLFGLSDKRTISSMRAFAMLLEATHQKQQASELKQQISRAARVADNGNFQNRY